MAAITSNGPLGGGGLLCFPGSLTVCVVQTEPLGLVLLSDRLIHTSKDVFLQRKNSPQADDVFSGKF